MHARADSILGRVIDEAHQARWEDLPFLTAEAARGLGAVDAELYVVDYEQVELIPARASENASAFSEATRTGTVRIDSGDAAARAFSHVEIVHERAGDEHLLWVPLLDGTERLGVLGFRFPSDDAVDRDGARQLAGLMAELVHTRSLYGDTMEMLRRRRPMSLQAELQWRLLPPLTYSTPRVVISCVLTPCYDVGGDAFDYALDGTTLRYAIFDAMGHGLEASLLAAVTLGAYRNARRRGGGLADAYREISSAISQTFGPERFVTGVLCELDTETGELRRINAGHPAAIRMGADGEVSRMPIDRPSLPMGVGDEPALMTMALEPGDRLLLFTDGVTEARSADGIFFGSRRLLDVVKAESDAGLPAPEMLRRVQRALIEHQKGVFQDDATTMIVAWLGPDPQRVLP